MRSKPGSMGLPRLSLRAAHPHAVQAGSCGFALLAKLGDPNSTHAIIGLKPNSFPPNRRFPVDFSESGYRLIFRNRQAGRKDKAKLKGGMFYVYAL